MKHITIILLAIIAGLFISSTVDAKDNVFKATHGVVDRFLHSPDGTEIVLLYEYGNTDMGCFTYNRRTKTGEMVKKIAIKVIKGTGLVLHHSWLGSSILLQGDSANVFINSETGGVGRLDPLGFSYRDNTIDFSCNVSNSLTLREL